METIPWSQPLATALSNLATVCVMQYIWCAAFSINYVSNSISTRIKSSVICLYDQNEFAAVYVLICLHSWLVFTLSAIRRIVYDRDFLMSLRSTTLSKEKPEGLPNFSDIILNKPNTGGDSFRERMRNDLNPSFFKPMNVSDRAVARYCLLQVVERFCWKVILYANLVFAIFWWLSCSAVLGIVQSWKGLYCSDEHYWDSQWVETQNNFIFCSKCAHLL